MTSIQKFIKDLQEEFPNQMKDMWENNQFLLEDITLKAKKMHEQEIEDAFNDGINDECLGKNTTPEEFYKNTYEKTR